MSANPSNKGDVDLIGHDGEVLPMRTLYFDQTPEREIHIVCSPDRMRAYMKVLPGAAFAGVTREQLLALAADAGISFGLIEPGVVLLAGTQNSGAPFDGYCQIAVGEYMRRGEDGSIEFHVQPTSLEPRYDETETGNIDYKNLNLIENCFAGQRVASILPPGPGRPGRNVFGEEIAAESGSPVVVQPGPGVVVGANGRDFSSEIEGRLVYENGVLSVSPVLEITRDIDLGIGNVDFVGKVVVKGSLLDGFYINGKHGVEIHGDMGAARVSSDGDVKISGGVKGKGAAIITCRNLTAHYIDDATVEATGNVQATKEILNSDVKAIGRVSVTGGTVLGGVVCGFRGVEADTAGSELGVTTWVVSGINWTEENKKEEIRAQVAEYMDRVQSSEVMLAPLFGNPEISARLGSEQKSMLSELISELREVRESLLDLLQDRAKIDGNRQDGMVDQININKMLYMGVAVRFSGADGEIKDSVKGPLTITQGVDGKGIRIGGQEKMPALREKSGDADKAGEE